LRELLSAAEAGRVAAVGVCAPGRIRVALAGRHEHPVGLEGVHHEGSEEVRHPETALANERAGERAHAVAVEEGRWVGDAGAGVCRRAETLRAAHLDRHAVERVDESHPVDRRERRRSRRRASRVAEEVVDAARRARAHASVADIAERVGVTVVARGSVRRHRVRAGRVQRVADTRIVALVLGGADDRVDGRTRAALAGVALRAGVAVVARGAVGLGRVRAQPRARVARARVVALVLRRTGDGIAGRARAALAGVAQRAGVAVVAPGAVGLARVRAQPRARVARARVVALVLRRTGDGSAGRARAALAGVAQRAGVAVVAPGAVGLARVRAQPRARVARARVVALVLRRTGDGSAGRARAALAGVAQRAGVAVVAPGAVGLARVRAQPRARVARARVVALVLRRTDDRIARARAALAGVGLRAGVAVVAPTAVGDRHPVTRAGRADVGR